MPQPPSHILGLYLHLAQASAARRQPMVRDKLLVLAGVTATEMGLDQISSLCRERILTHNAWHLVGKWPSLGEAATDERFQSYLKQLRRRYSPEKAEHMLQSLGIEMGRERDAYYSDHEYAAALLRAESAPAGTLRSAGTDPPDTSANSIGEAVSPLGAGSSTSKPDRSSRGWLVEWGPFALGLVMLVVIAVVRFLPWR